MISIDSDGRVWRDGHEIITLTDRDQDELCRQLYPTDSVIRDDYMTRKRAKSYTGSRYGFATLTDISVEHVDHTFQLPDEQLLAIGGPRLLAIYQANSNLAVAAADLNMREDALRRWFHRWRQTEASHELQGILDGTA